MKKIQSLISLKILAYILIPILTLNILVSVFSISFYEASSEEFHKGMSYFETKQFANNFLLNIYNTTNLYIKHERDNLYILESESNENVITEATAENESNSTLKIETTKNLNYEQNYYKDNLYEYLIIDGNGIAYTNIEKTVRTDTVEKLKTYIQGKKYSWMCQDGIVETSIDKMQYYYIAYNTTFEKIKQTNATVYAAVKDEQNAEFYTYNLVYDIISNTYENATPNIVISILFMIIAIIYIIFGIGHQKGKEEIYTNFFDKISFEIVGIIGGILLIVEAGFLIWTLKMTFETSILTKGAVNLMLIFGVIVGLIIYATIATILVTIIRRIKAKIFWKNTLIYKFIKWIKRTISELFDNTNENLKTILIYGGFLFAQFLLFALGTENEIFYLLLIVLWIYTLKKILIIKGLAYKIKEKITSMYNGDTTNKLNEEEFKGELKQIAKELNDISGGLSNAIEEAMKSERLKTELITNVSHDIKTPLTSIINYVDLMKKENIENEKVKKYLEVLDNKSQRLKKLTEDLVEASKASSGNINLNIEKLNIKELINQVSGEFKDKFEKRGLQLIEQLPKDDVYIQADSRYMYRVLENMYVNISKYAMENSRVYIDIKNKNKKVFIELKNISQDKLNISVDELMQRFVRGDSARTTEGSGLGISIAKSLTELQGGKFEIYLDGDLFKVMIEFETA